MTEAFLHHLWKLKIFNSGKLKTIEGESLEILKTGQHNSDSGPDFFNAQVKIGDTHWAGNVEIHLKSSDWKNHFHDQDAAYDNVILHVVFEHDGTVMRKNGSRIPEFELKNQFDERLWRNYQSLLQSNQWIACQHLISKVDPFTLNNWIDRLLIERLENKTGVLFSSLQSNNSNWEETFYQHLARNFGFRLNALPFEMLAKSLPVSCLAKHHDRLLQLEAMLFGQAGMLEKSMEDDYPNELKQEYVFLKKKFGLEPMALHQWKFLRLRPVNFPTIRIAQFAQLVHHSSHLFSKILECKKVDDLKIYFRFEVSTYWQTHFIFDKQSKKQTKALGSGSFENIVINTIVPFLFAYGQNRGSEIHQQRAIQFLEEIPSEKNSILSGWKKIGIDSRSGYYSQALLQLKNEYCLEKKCLNCSIGNYLLQNVV